MLSIQRQNSFLEQLFFDAQISYWIGRVVVAFFTFNLVSIGRFLFEMDIENVSNGVFASIELQRWRAILGLSSHQRP